LVAPPAHWSAHWPWEQTWPAAQAVPQAPQLAGSSWVSKQRFPHFVVPPRQSTTHEPREQTRLASQALPHAPQFAGSFCKSAQVPAQGAWPALQVEPPPVDAPLVDVELLLVAVELPPVPPPDEHPCRAVPLGSESNAPRTSHGRWFKVSRFIVSGS
jgi:hypothetical protein